MKDKLSNIFLKVYIIGYEYISVSWRRGTPISMLRQSYAHVASGNPEWLIWLVATSVFVTMGQ